MDDVILTPIRISDLESLVYNQSRRAMAEFASGKPEQKTVGLMNVQQAAEFIGRSKATIYSLVHLRKIPFMKKGGLFFSRKQLTDWINSGSMSTQDDIDAEIKENALKGLER